MSTRSLSFAMAFLININIMFGSGVFINTVVLGQRVGWYGFLSYFCVAILLLPLIVTLSKLMARHTDNGFYGFAEPLGTAYAFASAWCYFVGKLASAALLIHVFAALLKTVVPSLPMPWFGIEYPVLALFWGLNLLHMNATRVIMFIFFILKITPIGSACIASVPLFSLANFQSPMPSLDAFMSTLPLVLYAFVGFEASCALSRKLENPSRTGPRVIWASFITAVFITISYQFLIMGAIGDSITTTSNFLHILPELFRRFLQNNVLAESISSLFHTALAVAALGGSYGLLFSTHWNLYTIAQKKLLPGSTFLTQLNKHHVPVVTVAIQMIVCALYLSVAEINQGGLQQVSVIGCTIAYALSCLSAYVSSTTRNERLIAGSGLISCAVLASTAVKNLLISDYRPLFLFVVLSAVGAALYLYQKNFNKKIAAS